MNLLRRALRGAPVIVLLASMVCSSASAQRRRGDDSTSEAEHAEARALFMAGQAAVDSGRWADAVDNFSRAYELSRVPAALYNLGFALRALGRHKEARDAFDQLLEEHRSTIDRQLAREARRYRDEAASRVAMLTVEGLEVDRRYQIRFDGQAVNDDGTRPVRVEADAGTHTLTIRSPDHSPFVWEGELADGQRETIDAELTPVRLGGEGSGSGSNLGGGAGGPVEEDGGVLSSPVFWVITIAVLLGGGAVAAYFINESVQLEGNSRRMIELD